MREFGFQALGWVWLVLICTRVQDGSSQDPSRLLREDWYQTPPSSGTTWIEVIERYCLPCDPGLPPPDAPLLWNDKMFRSTWAEYQKRASNTGKSAEQLQRGQASLDRWKKSREAAITKLMSKPHPVTVYRAWDGIRQRQMYFSLGEGQEQLERKLSMNKVYEVKWDLGRPYDDLQGRRATISSLVEDKPIPSEFARWSDVEHRYEPLQFGEAKLPRPGPPRVFATKKLGEVGDGLYSFIIPASYLGDALSDRFPWYCEYEIYELNVDGVRGKLATASAVAPAVFAPFHGPTGWDPFFSATYAEGRFRIERPSPWGYEIEVTRWFGLVPTILPQRTRQPSASPPLPARPPIIPGGLAPPTPGGTAQPRQPSLPRPPESPISPPDPLEPQP